MPRLTKNWNDEEIVSEKMVNVYEDTIRLRESMKNSFEYHCKTGLFTLKFPLFDYVVENVESLSQNILSASLSEKYNIHIISRIPKIHIKVHFKNVKAGLMSQ